MSDSTSTANPAMNAQALAALSAYGLVFVVIFLVLIVLQVIILWRITAKAGYSGVLSLLMFVPLVNFIIPLIFAFSEWPIERKLKALEHGQGMSLPTYIPPATT